MSWALATNRPPRQDRPAPSPQRRANERSNLCESVTLAFGSRRGRPRRWPNIGTIARTSCWMRSLPRWPWWLGAEGRIDAAERGQLLDFLDRKGILTVHTPAEILEMFENRVHELNEPDGPVGALKHL